MRELVILVAIVGCGGGGSGGGSVAIGDYGSSVAKAYCEFLEGCGAVANQPSCLTLFAGVFDVTSSVAAVNAGKVTYSASAAGECVNAIESMACDRESMSVRSSPAACQQVFTGTVATGGACMLGTECASASCAQLCDTTTTCCAGTCNAPPAAIGAACGAGVAGCVAGAYCNAEAAAICDALGQVGSACQEDNQCAAELACIQPPDGSGSGACQPAAAEGSDCSAAPCAELDDNCNSTTMKCTKVVDVGATCANENDCLGLLICDASLKCAVAPTLGQPCPDGVCSDTSFCSRPSGSAAATCTAPLANGAACIDDSNCTSAFCIAAAAGSSAGSCGAPTPCF